MAAQSESPDPVLRAQGGDPGAFDELVRAYQDRVVGYAAAILRDRAQAEDVAQEAFVVAYHRLGQLREPRAFAGWLRRITFAQCDRVLRRRRPEAGLDGSERAPSEDGGNPERALELQRLRAEVRAAVRALPDGERIATTLFYMGGHTQREIADFLDVSVTAVKSRLHSARGRLRARLHEGVLVMVEETLQNDLESERPSRDGDFADKVGRMIRAVKFLLMAQDMERAVRFYRESLGLTVRVESEHWSELSHGDAIVALHGGGTGAFQETGLSFTVENLEEACARVEAAGGRIRNAPRERPGEPIRLAEVTDPEGNGFMLAEDVG